MRTSRTPGPWTANAQGEIYSPKGDLIACAAPELLEACKACDRAFVSWQVGQIPGRPEDILALISQVRAVIAKVEGTAQ